MKILKAIDRKLRAIDEMMGSAKDEFSWQPIKDSPQAQAYFCEADELLFGGQAGGGKTDLIVGLALTNHQRSLILRRRATDLSALISRTRELTGALGTASMRIGSRILEFGGCKDDASKFKYKGRAHDLKAFDELSEFSQDQYQFICAWNRTADPNQRCRIVATTNPPDTNEGRWIIQHWAAWLDPAHPNPAKSGQLRWFLGNEEVDGPDPINGQLPRSRTFIRAAVEDNPYMMASGYDRLLDNLPDGIREKLRLGNFTYEIEDNPRQLIPSGWIESAQQRYREGQYRDDGNVTIGVDPARGGIDRTVLAVSRGDVVQVYGYPGSKTPDGSSVVQLILQHWTSESNINLDVIGIGASVIDYLRDLGYSCKAVNFSSASHRRDRSGLLKFSNLRTEIFWNLRDELDPHYNPTIALPPDPGVLSELTAIRYRLSHRGIQCESKDEIRSRIGRSTDVADAIALSRYRSLTYSGSF